MRKFSTLLSATEHRNTETGPIPSLSCLRSKYDEGYGGLRMSTSSTHECIYLANPHPTPLSIVLGTESIVISRRSQTVTYRPSQLERNQIPIGERGYSLLRRSTLCQGQHYYFIIKSRFIYISQPCNDHIHCRCNPL